MSVDTATTPILDCARAPSATLTASTPASFNNRTPSSIFEGSQPFGGTISTEVTNSALQIFFAKRERSACGTTCTSGGFSSGTKTRTVERPGDSAAAAFAICLMCSGVVPQQPPTNFAPAWIKRLAYLAMYSGEAM